MNWLKKHHLLVSQIVLQKIINKNKTQYAFDTELQITWESERTNLMPLPGYIFAPLNRQSSVLKSSRPDKFDARHDNILKTSDEIICI